VYTPREYGDDWGPVKVNCQVKRVRVKGEKVRVGERRWEVG